MMKIFVLGTRGFPNVQGGVERHCEELYPRLVKLGCEVVVCTRLFYIKSQQRNGRWKGVCYKHLWAPREKNLEAIVHTFLGVITAWLNSVKILHIHSIGPAILTPFAKLLGMKVVFTHHGSDYQRKKWGKFAKSVLRLGEFLGVRFADRVIVVSRTSKYFLVKKYRRKDIVYIPNGVGLPKIEPAGNMLEKYSLNFKNYVFTACRFVPEKGLHDLIDAYKKVNNPRFRLVIVGDADHETDYSRELKKKACDAGVVLTGFLTGRHLAELFSNAGLFVLPSYHEGLPIALLEALSYGLPVLASNIAANRDVPLPEFRYFNVGDSNDLSRRIQELMKKGISQTEEQEQKELLNRDYNWGKIAKDTYNLVASVCYAE